MELRIENYQSQVARWPQSGKHILAQFDPDSIVVYQAYKPSIAQFAVKHQYFGGSFSLERMSWIKTNFLWMMYRSNWGTNFNQEMVLAIWIKRAAFEQILAEAVHSSFSSELYGTREEWGDDLHRSNVRLQWDPDHGPQGHKQERRAVQLGMKGQTLKSFSKEWIVRVEDISSFVAAQRELVEAGRLKELLTPVEYVYGISDPALALRVGVDEWTPHK